MKHDEIVSIQSSQSRKMYDSCECANVICSISQRGVNVSIAYADPNSGR